MTDGSVPHQKNKKKSLIQTNISFLGGVGCTLVMMYKKKRLTKKIWKQELQNDVFCNVWDGSNKQKKRILKMSISKMIEILNEEWLNQTGY